MKNKKKGKSNKTKVPVPYSSEYIASQLKLFLLPLLGMGNVVEKYSEIVSGLVEFSDYYLCYYDNTYTEWRLFNKVHQHTYINSFKSIHYNLMQLAGQMILKEQIYISDIDQIISNINQNLDVMYEIGDCIDEFICVPKEDGYPEVYEFITTAKSNFDKFYEKYQKSDKNIETINLNSLDLNIQKYETKLISVYKYLLVFASYVFQLGSGHKIYPCKYILATFSRSLAKILFGSAGEFYMGINSCKDIELKLKRNIAKCFKKLETNSYKNIPPIKDIFDYLPDNSNLTEKQKNEDIDNEILNTYQQLKQEINKNGLCHLK